ncbi:LysR family transcriptional regulator [Vineibacter terrae]|uniref:LysR family transcriptional regulator n=1 Tax=Vineibacter terrae TaxID=2586908 RepID=UPI002E356CF2|nr:LysR substrate-binding domain-containing protein [Vineibacter terrae]HEX2890603.1 LysR substrate-binding domain-containing protein [Vineibacter terrae]
MDAADLRIFEAVARLGGMNRAAAELNTVQSNVTARVRLLEDELGTPLFHRHSRGVALTPAGQRLLPYAERVAQLLVDARRATVDDGTPRGPLVIGALETTAALRLSPLLSSYVAAWPEVDLALRTGTTCELVEQVAAHQLEGAFVCGPVDHPELAGEALFREELVLATARGVRTLDALIGEGDLKIVVLRAGCSYRQRLEDILARRGAVGARLLEFGTIEAILGCVAAGLGVTLLPRALVAGSRHGERIALHALPVHEAHVETLFIRRRDNHVSSALRAFLDHVRPPLLHAQAAE